MCVERVGDGGSEGHPNEGERGLDRRRQFGQRRTRGLVQLILAAKGAAGGLRRTAHGKGAGRGDPSHASGGGFKRVMTF